MFYRVLKTFSTFLVWYSLFLFAFGLGFYILLHEDNGGTDREYAFFDHLGLCLVKTFSMFVGELEFSDIPFNSPFSYIFFLTFVFLIVVVLMNLLNGLAVRSLKSAWLGKCIIIKLSGERHGVDPGRS